MSDQTTQSGLDNNSPRAGEINSPSPNRLDNNSPRPGEINSPSPNLQQHPTTNSHEDNDDSTKIKPTQKLSSNLAEFFEPLTESPPDNNIEDRFFELRQDVKEFKASQLQSWELFKDDFTAS